MSGLPGAQGNNPGPEIPRPRLLNGATIHGVAGQRKLRHPAEWPLVWASAVITAIAYGLWAATLAWLALVPEHTGVGTYVRDFLSTDSTAVQALLFLPFMPIIIWVVRAMMYANMRSNAVQMSPTQFPEGYRMVVEAAQRQGLRRVPDAYVLLGNGAINAFASGHGFRRFVVVYSDLFEIGGRARDPEALRFVINHEVGHLAAGHVSYFRLLLTLLARQLPLLGPALSRAQEYTADNYGYDAAPQGVAGVMGLLTAGKYLGAQVNTHAPPARRACGCTWLFGGPATRCRPGGPMPCATGTDRAGSCCAPRRARPGSRRLGLMGRSTPQHGRPPPRSSRTWTAASLGSPPRSSSDATRGSATRCRATSCAGRTRPRRRSRRPRPSPTPGTRPRAPAPTPPRQPEPQEQGPPGHGESLTSVRRPSRAVSIRTPKLTCTPNTPIAAASRSPVNSPWPKNERRPRSALVQGAGPARSRRLRAAHCRTKPVVRGRPAAHAPGAPRPQLTCGAPWAPGRPTVMPSLMDCLPGTPWARGRPDLSVRLVRVRSLRLKGPRMGLRAHGLGHSADGDTPPERQW